MRIVIPTTAVLALASGVNAYVLSAPDHYATGAPGPGKQIPILVSGTETQVLGVTLDLVIPHGEVTDLDPQTGTVLENSLFPVDPIYIFADAHEVCSDYAMDFGSSTDLTAGKAATLTIDTTGLQPGTYGSSE